METSTYRGRLTFVRVHCWSLWSQVINAWWKIPSGGPNLVRQWGNQDMKLRIKRDLVVGQYLHNWQDEYFVIKHGHFFYPSGRKKSGQIARHSLHDVTDLKHWVLLAVKTEVILGRQTWQCHCSINNNTLCRVCWLWSIMSLKRSRWQKTVRSLTVHHWQLATT